MDEGHSLQGFVRVCPTGCHPENRNVSVYWWLWEIWVRANSGERMAMPGADAPFLDKDGGENYERGVCMCGGDVTVFIRCQLDSI